MSRSQMAVAEKRQIINLTLVPGATVALVTRAHGRNANHVLKWRRAFERSELVDSAVAFTALLSVTAAPGEAEIRQLAAQQQPAFGSIICLPTGTRLSTRSLPLCSIVLVREKDRSRVLQSMFPAAVIQAIIGSHLVLAQRSRPGRERGQL
jgi:transposase-like protein